MTENNAPKGTPGQVGAQRATRYRLKPLPLQEGVVDLYKKIESGVLGTYQKIEDAFVEKFLEPIDDEPEGEPEQPEPEAAKEPREA